MTAGTKKQSSSASREELQRVFNKYVDHKDANGQQYIKGATFITQFVGVQVSEGAKEEVMQLLNRVADTTNNGLISFEEFCAFEKLLTTPEAPYRMVFRLFDATSSGFITFSEFQQVYSKTTAHATVPFEFNCEFVRRHFGENKKRELSYSEFSEFINELQVEHVKQAFAGRDKDKDGSIFPLDLMELMSSLRTNVLTPFVSENLIALAKGNKMSFSAFLALNKVLSNIEQFQSVLEETLRRKGNSSKDQFVLKEEFMSVALDCCPSISPLDVDILFQLVESNSDAGRLTRADFDKLVPVLFQTTTANNPSALAKSTEPVEGRSFFLAAAESVYKFALGSVAGCVGATAVYPIDLVKTRLQNQRSVLPGEVMYKNFWDCFFKVIRFEGYLGLYRGLPPQLVGVAPEKAIKLTMNDVVRNQFTRQDGSISIWGEIIAGGTAGGCQVIFTNPLEIVKIRLQVAGEVASAQKVTAVGVIRELGLFGLYKGSRACFLRDIPFSAIYFPLYANLKKAFQDENGVNSMRSLFTAGVIAGIPAPFLTTPADVIKTRLQVSARAGQTTYNGVIDCARKMWAQEGPRVFWRGANQRVFRSAPQFGVTLLTFEVLQKLLPVDFGGHKSAPSAGSKSSSSRLTSDQFVPSNSDHIGGLRTASLAFAGMESKFGLFLPKFQHAPNAHLYDMVRK